jgi:hypothetical protein
LKDYLTPGKEKETYRLSLKVALKCCIGVSAGLVGIAGIFLKNFLSARDSKLIT